MTEQKDVLILAIESSCDETAASVVTNGRDGLSNVISSQIELHKLYGGVVPEIASRKHIEKINQVIEEALEEASVSLDDLDAIGVTYGPGLVGALLVGVAEAKAIGDNVWLSANFEKNDKNTIQLAIDNNIGVSFWTVNTIEDAKMLYEMGIRYFETDILCN